MSKGVALALSGGGARGFAHIPVCEAFDDCGVTPSCIAGTSMGALIGALYASGMKASDVREQCIAMFAKRSDVMSRLMKVRGRGRLLSISFTKSGALDPKLLLEAFLPEDLPPRIEDLPIPFKAVAVDFTTGNEVVFEKGPLLSAIAASIAFPPVMRGVVDGERVLLDGGIVNPTPHEVAGRCGDPVIASDVVTLPNAVPGEVPPPITALIGSAQIMMRAIAQARYAAHVPALVVYPDIRNMTMFDFFQVADIIAKGEAAGEEVCAWLRENVKADA
ncbi:patatin-like phospholipase family protein [Tepidamorphus sp. 3E244]|uniref:patatin-like phospholipase family protein n=1 Tax=Tepidamorphus sp. 3E244 TaxID=3385498 RepID=UPI0038FC167D